MHQAATGAIPAKRTRQDITPAAPPNGTSEAGPSTSKKARKDSATDPEPQTQNRDHASGHQHQQETSESVAAGPAFKYKPGEVVFAKVKGYPGWPGMVTDTAAASALLKAVQGSRPYLIRFFPDDDFVWAHAKEMKALTSGDVDAFFANAKEQER